MLGSYFIMCVQESDGYLKEPFFIYEKKIFFPTKISATFQETTGVPFPMGRKFIDKQIVAN